MFDLWQRTRGGMGPFSVGHLPETGGVMDQHAPTMEALDELSRSWSWLEERFPHEPKVKPKAKAR